MKKQILQNLIILVITSLYSASLLGQQVTDINPNALFDFGVTTGQLHFYQINEIQSDQEDNLEEVAKFKFEHFSKPNQSSSELNLSEASGTSLAGISKNVSRTDIPFCGHPFFENASLISEIGHQLANVILTSGTDCTDCLSSGLMDAELDINALANAIEEAGMISLGQDIMAVSKELGRVERGLSFSAQGEAALDQNAEVGTVVETQMKALTILFEDAFYSCSGTISEASQSDEVCMVSKLETIAEDSLTKTLLATAAGTEFIWRYRAVGTGDWTYAEEKDSILIIEKTIAGDFEVEVAVWCGETLDYSPFARETITFEYQYYGCHAPHKLYVSHVKKYSAWLHCKAYGYKIQWAYRRAGNSWKYLTNRKRSLYYRSLRSGTYYEFKCRVWCGSRWSSWSYVKRFKTYGGGYQCHVNRPTASHITKYGCRTTVHVHGKRQWAVRPRGGHWKYYTNYHKWMNWKCQPSTSYECKVRVVCHGKWSPWSSICTWTTPGSYCGTPSSSKLSAYNIGQTTATTKVNVSATSYKWAIRPRGGSWNYFSAGSKVNWKDLNPGTTYDYRVKIYCHGKWSNYSSYRSFTTKSSYCHAPSGYDIWYSNLTSSTVDLRISTSASKIEYALYHNSWNNWKKWISTKKSFHIYDMSSNTTYYYAMRVYCNGRWSDWSPTENFKTKSRGRSAEKAEGVILGEGSAPMSETPTLDGKEFTVSEKLQVVADKEINEVQSVERPMTTLNIYPNPAINDISIDGINGVARLKMMNMQGQITLDNLEVHAGDKINVQHLAPGNYQVLVTLEDGSVSSQKLVIIQ